MLTAHLPHLQPPLHVGLHRVEVAVAPQEGVPEAAEARVEARRVQVDVRQLQLNVLQLALLMGDGFRSGKTLRQSPFSYYIEIIAFPLE